MINNFDKQDEKIRKLVRRQGIEKAPDGFTDKVMMAVEKEHEDLFDRFLDPKMWVYIGIGVAAVATILITIGITGIGRLFSIPSMESLSKNLFNASIFSSFINLFTSFKISTITAVILCTAFGLVLIDFVMKFRRSKKIMMICI